MFIPAHQFCSIRGERSQHHTYPHQTGAQLDASVYKWRPDVAQDVLMCMSVAPEAKQEFSRKHLLSRLKLGPRRALNWICCNWSYS